MKRPDFYESQKFTQWWVWAVILSSCLALTGISIAGMYQQFVEGIPYGNKPMPDTGLAIFTMVNLIISAALIWLFRVMKLETRIDKVGVHYRYFPLIPSWQTLTPHDISKWSVEKYLLLGYGIRYNLRGVKTLNVRGNKGLELSLTKGKKLRLGTQKPEEIELAMKALYKTDNDY